MSVRLLTMCSVVTLIATHALAAETGNQTTRSLAKGGAASADSVDLLDGESFMPIAEGALRAEPSDAAEIAPVRTASIGERSTDLRSLARRPVASDFEIVASLGVAESGFRSSSTANRLNAARLLRFFAAADHGGSAATSAAVASSLIDNGSASPRAPQVKAGVLDSVRLAAVSPVEAKPDVPQTAAVSVNLPVSEPFRPDTQSAAVKVGDLRQIETVAPIGEPKAADRSSAAARPSRKLPVATELRQAPLRDQATDLHVKAKKPGVARVALHAAPKVFRPRAMAASVPAPAAAPDPQQSAAQIAALRAFTRMP